MRLHARHPVFSSVFLAKFDDTDVPKKSLGGILTQMLHRCEGEERRSISFCFMSNRDSHILWFATCYTSMHTWSDGLRKVKISSPFLGHDKAEYFLPVPLYRSLLQCLNTVRCCSDPDISWGTRACLSHTASQKQVLADSLRLAHALL